MRLWENTSATLHAESDTENFKESEREPQNIAGPKITRRLLKLNGCLTKRTCCLAVLSNEKISHNSIIGNAKKSNWQWTSAYTAAITFPICNIMCARLYASSIYLGQLSLNIPEALRFCSSLLFSDCDNRFLGRLSCYPCYNNQRETRLQRRSLSDS